MKEELLYPHIAFWLHGFLQHRYHPSNLVVADTHRFTLSDFIRRTRYEEHFKNQEWQAYDIRVDITGLMMVKGSPAIAFVECKTGRASLLNVSQLLGYSRVANPVFSCLVSVRGVSPMLRRLLLTYGRLDVLQYAWPKGRMAKTLVLATWDTKAKGIDPASVFPPGGLEL